MQGSGDNGVERPGARRTAVLAAVGFSLFLTAVDFMLWGRAFLNAGVFGVDEIRVFYSVPSVAALGVVLAVSAVASARSVAWASWGCRLCGAGGLAGTIGGISLLGVLHLAGVGSTAPLVLAAVLAGAGTGLAMLAWQAAFARVGELFLAPSVLGACVAFPLFSMACSFLSLGVAYGVTGAAACASFAVLVGVEACLHRAAAGLSRPVSDPVVSPTSAAPSGLSLRGLLADWGPTMLCLASLGFVTGVSRTLTLAAVRETSELVFESLACMLAVAVLLLAVWRVRGRLVSPVVFYQVAFPVVATGLVVFSVVANDFTSSFAGLSYFVFELALIVAIVHCAQESGGGARGTLVAYGLVAGCAYMLLGLGTAVGYALQQWGDGTATPVFFIVVIVCIYALSLPLAVQARRRAPEKDAHKATAGGRPALSSAPVAEPDDPAALAADAHLLFDRQARALAAGYGLTPRESEVLALVLAGLDSPTAATRLGLTDNTVRTHKKNLYRKLGVHSKQEILALLDAGSQDAPASEA